MKKIVTYSIALALAVQGIDILLGPEHTDNLAIYLVNSLLRLPTSIVLATSLHLGSSALASFVMDYHGWINIALWAVIFWGILSIRRKSQMTKRQGTSSTP